MSKPRVRLRTKKERGSLAALPTHMSEFSSRNSALSGITGDQRRAIQELVELLTQHNLAELEVERGGFRVRVRRETGAAPIAATAWEHVPAPQEAPAESPSVAGSSDKSGMVTITSPIVGTFYRSPSPDADPYVEEGDLVKKGQVLCIVEAMKLMNEIESEVDGRIVKIMADSTRPVEYGQPLFLVDPVPAS